MLGFRELVCLTFSPFRGNQALVRGTPGAIVVIVIRQVCRSFSGLRQPGVVSGHPGLKGSVHNPGADEFSNFSRTGQARKERKKYATGERSSCLVKL